MGTVSLVLLLACLTSINAICDRTKCRLPDCLCADTDPPVGLKPEEIPQLVFLTFDDHVNESKFKLYQQIFLQRYNPNGCPIGLTFYVSHHHERDATNYELVNQLYRMGHEIASHTVTHTNDLSYWSQGSADRWRSEIDDANNIISRFANIPRSDIRGFRSPYLQTAADTTFEVIQSLGFEYESCMSTFNRTDPPLWPYTLDYGAKQDCPRGPCPEGKYPGLWSVPLVALKRRAGVEEQCPLADFCYISGAYNPATEIEAFHYFKSNFQRYSANKAPFGLYGHSYWFGKGNHVFSAYLKFVDYLLTKPDVYIVPVIEGLQWIKNPIKLKDLAQSGLFGCKQMPLATCRPRDCSFEHTAAGGSYLLRSCTRCPDEYPWLGNPFGKALSNWTVEHDPDEL